MEDFAIDIQNVSKVYRLYDQPIDRLKECLNIGKKVYHKDFDALYRISFHVRKGEMLGIIGKNGAGKSTLLKIITGVLSPTSGKISINGKISALLELGAGFNPEYTGLENIYLNGTMIGFTREEMDAKIEDIISFADIGDFIHQPVKTYSSGMFARLAFAVSINVEPDILIVDEALSVGDVFFQAKCYKKLEKLKEVGTTILFVTHDMGSVIKYCDRAILLNDGHKIDEGLPKDMVDIYKKILVGQYKDDSTDKVVDSSKEKEIGSDLVDCNVQWKDYMLINPNFQEYGNHKANIIDFGIADHEGQITNNIYKLNDFQVKIKIRFNEEIRDPIFAFSIKDIKGTELTGTNTIIEQINTGIVKKDEVVEIMFKQKMILQGGQYLLLLGCTGYEGEDLVVYHRLYDICLINVISDKTTVGYFDMDSKVILHKDEYREVVK